MCANCFDASKPFEPGFAPPGMPDISKEHARRILSRPKPAPLRIPADLWPDLEWTDEGVKWASR